MAAQGQPTDAQGSAVMAAMHAYHMDYAVQALPGSVFDKVPCDNRNMQSVQVRQLVRTFSSALCMHIALITLIIKKLVHFGDPGAHPCKS